MLESTLSIVKPDAVKKNLIGKIIGRFEQEGLKIIATKMQHLSLREAEGFYAEHRERGFFRELVDFMTSGPVLISVLRGENAIERNRDIMGATNPAQAKEGTLRKLYADSIGENAVHGSDSAKSAEREIRYFFSETELCN